MSEKAFLRSDNWFGPHTPVDLRAHHTGKLINSKLTPEELTGTNHPLKDRTRSGRRPVIGICSFGGDLNPCQALHDQHLGSRVAEGVRDAGMANHMAIAWPANPLSLPFRVPRLRLISLQETSHPIIPTGYTRMAALSLFQS